MSFDCRFKLTTEAEHAARHKGAEYTVYTLAHKAIMMHRRPAYIPLEFEAYCLAGRPTTVKPKTQWTMNFKKSLSAPRFKPKSCIIKEYIYSETYMYNYIHLNLYRISFFHSSVIRPGLKKWFGWYSYWNERIIVHVSCVRWPVSSIFQFFFL